MQLTESQFKEFEEAAWPLIKFLRNNCHPHITVIVSNSSAELLEALNNVVYNHDTQCHAPNGCTNPHGDAGVICDKCEYNICQCMECRKKREA